MASEVGCQGGDSNERIKRLAFAGNSIQEIAMSALASIFPPFIAVLLEVSLATLILSE